MNRASPGSLDKRLTHKRLYFIFEEILPKVQYFLDMHNSGDRIDVLPLAFTRKDAKEDLLQFVMTEGLDLIWEGMAGEPGMLYEGVNNRGVLTCGSEIGSVEWQRKVIQNVLKGQGIIEGEPELPNEYRIVTGHPHYSRHGGFWFPKVKMRDEVEKGDVIGSLYDIFGELIEEVRATHPGVVCSIRHYPETNPGNELVGYHKVIRTIKR
jgi:predicted deacylase